MSDAFEKTKSHERVFIDINELDPNEENPNSMSDAQFNMLYDNMEATGLTDPILVRPVNGRYRVVGGHHRLEVAKILDFTEVPCTVITDTEFDDDKERFQMVRMNIIHGEMSPEKFIKMYDKMSAKYSDEVLKDSFGFVDESEFKSMIRATANQLPPEMKAKFEEAAKEIKTIDGLANILNDLFTKHGDTLPYGYMIFDFGGKDSMWLQMSKKCKPSVLNACEFAKANGKSIDATMSMLLKWFESPEADSLKEKITAEAPDVVIPKEVDVPSLDFLDGYTEV